MPPISLKRGGVKIRPTQSINYIKGLRASFQSISAAQSDQYSWFTRTEETFVFTAEIDLKNKARNRYNHMEVPYIRRCCHVMKVMVYLTLTPFSGHRVLEKSGFLFVLNHRIGPVSRHILPAPSTQLRNVCIRAVTYMSPATKALAHS